MLGCVGALLPFTVGAASLQPPVGATLSAVVGPQVAVLTPTDRTFSVSIANFHPEFDFYRMTSADGAGICAMLSSTRGYARDEYGGAAKTAFALVRAQLTAAYGAADEFTDTVRPGSYWQAPHEWVRALSLKDRVYRAEWHAPAGHTFGDSVTHIVLAVQALADSRAFMTLLYQFDDARCRGVDPGTEASRLPTIR
jgi:hypothetical protein